MTIRCKNTPAWLSCLDCTNIISITRRTCKDDAQLSIDNPSAIDPGRPRRQVDTGGVTNSGFAQLAISCCISRDSCRTFSHWITAKVYLQTNCFEIVYHAYGPTRAVACSGAARWQAASFQLGSIMSVVGLLAILLTALRSFGAAELLGQVCKTVQSCMHVVRSVPCTAPLCSSYRWQRHHSYAGQPMAVHLLLYSMYRTAFKLSITALVEQVLYARMCAGTGLPPFGVRSIGCSRVQEA